MKSTESLESVGGRIRRVRKDNKLSQKAFGKICGVSQLTLLRYETNYRGPDMKFLLKMSENFNVNINWVLRKIGKTYFSDAPKETARVYIDIGDLHEAFQAFSTFLQMQAEGKLKKLDSNGNNGSKPFDTNVLLVCNDERFLPSLGRPLSKEGYNVVVCPDFEEAEKLMGEKGFQLLVLDMRLGSSETRRFLDALHGRNETAVLLLTDSGQTERILDSLEQLKADYLDRSGLSERELLFKVSRLLKYNGQMGSVIETGN